MKKLLFCSLLASCIGTAFAEDSYSLERQLDSSDPYFAKGVIETGIPLDKIQDRTSRYLEAADARLQEAERLALEASEAAKLKSSSGLPLLPASIGEGPVYVDRANGTVAPLNSAPETKPLAGHAPGVPAPVFRTMSQAAEAGAQATEWGAATTTTVPDPLEAPVEQNPFSAEFKGEASTPSTPAIPLITADNATPGAFIPAPISDTSSMDSTFSNLPPIHSDRGPALVYADYKTWYPWAYHWVTHNQNDALQYGAVGTLVLLVLMFFGTRRRLPS